MPNQPQHQPDAAPDKLRQLPSWARRYAQSRNLGLLVALAAFAAGFGIFAGLGLLLGSAYRAGSMTAVVACYALSAGFTIFWVWLIIVGMKRLVGASTAHLYRHEGEVTVLLEGKPCPPVGAKVIGPLIVAALLTAATAMILWSWWGHWPIEYMEKYMQPLAALVVTPFLVVLWGLNRKAMSPTILLWPALFALHAILIVAGAPIVFIGPLRGLNVFIPIVGYGLLTGLAGHLYNRHALARMRQLAGPVESDNGGEQS